MTGEIRIVRIDPRAPYGCSLLSSRNSVQGTLITTIDSTMAAAVEDKKQQQIEVAGGQQQQDGGAVSLGKGAWDCDTNTEIPPEKEAYVFEEIATMDHPFEGIPTVPRRKDMDHMAFFCGGCRYRVTAYPDWTARQVKEALFNGGIARSNKPEEVRNTPGIQKWEDIELIYAGQKMANDKTLETYHVPPVRFCVMITSDV